MNDRKAEARREIDFAENQIRGARAGEIDINPVPLAEFENQMRNRIEAAIRILEQHGATYVMPRDVLPILP